MVMVERVELGCPGHFILATHCRWRRHTRVGQYRISTVGDLYITDSATERSEVGFNRNFETMVFRLRPNGVDFESENCGCGKVDSWGEIDFGAYQTAGEAQQGHEAMVEKYLKLANQS